MFKKIQHWFAIYTQTFNTDDPEHNRNILLKIDHCARTADLMEDIASHEDLTPEHREIAKIIGLLHDIGRFEQYRQYRTFADHQSLNHGLLGSQILCQTQCLSGLNPRHQDWIAKSVQYHNCYILPADEDPQVLAFARMIRDADKIDIFQISFEYFRNRTEENKNTALELNLTGENRISDTIFDQIMSGQLVRMKDIQTIDDFKALQMSWIFDVHYRRSFEIISERQSLKKLYQTMAHDSDRAQTVYKKAQLFLEQRVQMTTVFNT